MSLIKFISHQKIKAMKKFLSALVFVAMTAVCVTSCSNSKNESENDGKSTENVQSGQSAQDVQAVLDNPSASNVDKGKALINRWIVLINEYKVAKSNNDEEAARTKILPEFAILIKASQEIDSQMTEEENRQIENYTKGVTFDKEAFVEMVEICQRLNLL